MGIVVMTANVTTEYTSPIAVVHEKPDPGMGENALQESEQQKYGGLDTGTRRFHIPMEEQFKHRQILYNVDRSTSP